MRYVRLPLALLALAAIAACGGGKSSSNAGSSGGSNAGSSAGTSTGSETGSQGAAAQNMPNCGAVQPVWVNLRTRKYHEPSDPAYGHTRHGEYLCPAQAKEQGFTRAGGGRRHHRRRAAGDQSDYGNQSGGGSDSSDNP